MRFGWFSLPLGIALIAYGYLSGGMSFDLQVTFKSLDGALVALVGGILADGTLLAYGIKSAFKRRR